ncbi:hypothetical protein AGMMS50267_02170 [Spirochaetia bacterium]|nr:hypothetical protein AGMMS50267_02170 [Spirochaetia bacterium]
MKKMADIELDTEKKVFSNIALIIEKRKFNAASTANSQVITMFWEIGKYINLDILADSRADYGKKILSTVSTKLVSAYGKSFVEANLYRMKRFAAVFPDINTIADFTPFLSWSHFCEIMRIKDEQAWLFYVAEFWTNLPPKAEFEKLLKNILEEAKVNNERAVQFRKWANTIIKDYTIQGWVMDAERLKHGGTVLTEDYFEKQLEKIREIQYR